jgi:hypothetical protein
VEGAPSRRALGADGQHNRSRPRRPWPRAILSVASRVPRTRRSWKHGKSKISSEQRIRAGQWHFYSCRRREVCKTVGSAYVGSNPTPATTCEDGPLAGNSRASGPFLLCPAACHLVALRVGVSRCPRTHSGRASVSPARSVCTVGFPRTATDGPFWRRVPACRAPLSRACILVCPSSGQVIPQSDGQGKGRQGMSASLSHLPQPDMYLPYTSGGPPVVLRRMSVLVARLRVPSCALRGRTR